VVAAAEVAVAAATEEEAAAMVAAEVHAAGDPPLTLDIKISLLNRKPDGIFRLAFSLQIRYFKILPESKFST